MIKVQAGRHSEKPEIFAKMIESDFPTLPKIELFVRGVARPGWKNWGNEAENPAGRATMFWSNPSLTHRRYRLSSMGWTVQPIGN